MNYLAPEHFEEGARRGIKARTLKQRVYTLGWTVQQALDTPPQRRGADKWDEWKEVATRHGVSRTIYHNRVMAHGWSCEEAATTPKMTRAEINRRSVRRVFTDEQLEIAKRNGISNTTLWNRVFAHKWSVEDAMTLPLVTNKESIRRARAASNWSKNKFKVSEKAK